MRWFKLVVRSGSQFRKHAVTSGSQKYGVLTTASMTNRGVVKTTMTSLFEQEAVITDIPPITKKKTLSIVREVKLNVEVRLNHLLDGLAENVADALFEEMWALEEKDALEHHFNVIRAVKLHSGIYRREFYKRIDGIWLTYLNRQELPELTVPPGNAGTLINSYRLKAEGHYKALIRDLKQRFSTLIGLDMHFYPLRAEVLYICFWQSIEKLDLKYDERLMLLSLFQRFVMDRYGQLLAIASHTLSEHAIEPLLEAPLH